MPQRKFMAAGILVFDFELFIGGLIQKWSLLKTAVILKILITPLKPPYETIISGNINGNCIIEARDFSIMALHWCGVKPSLIRTLPLFGNPAFVTD